MSFHQNYEKWLKKTDPKNCPVCKNEPMPEGMIDLYELQHSWFNLMPVDCMKYAAHITSKYHGIELFDLDDSELFGLMKDLQIYAKALKKVSNAVKINYEIHGNTTPHLHIHLYPRFLDDPFPNQPIDYHQQFKLYTDDEYDDLVLKLRSEIDNLVNNEKKGLF